MKRVWISNAKIFQLVWLMISLRVISAAEWFPALSSNVDDDTFHYYSDVWFNSTPFNTQYPNTKNALFESYSTIYVEKVRITMDGTTDKSCGTQCTFTFSLPESYAGRFTLKELVTTDGGIDLKDDRDISWVPLSFIPLHSISRLSFLFSSLRLKLTDQHQGQLFQIPRLHKQLLRLVSSLLLHSIPSPLPLSVTTPTKWHSTTVITTGAGIDIWFVHVLFKRMTFSLTSNDHALGSES
jgi:hypothetical protein